MAQGAYVTHFDGAYGAISQTVRIRERVWDRKQRRISAADKLAIKGKPHAKKEKKGQQKNKKISLNTKYRPLKKEKNSTLHSNWSKKYSQPMKSEKSKGK